MAAHPQSSLEHRSPEVSVVMACYNAQDYLEAAVQSALEQRDIDLEVLIIDDHSTDNSLAMAHRLADEDERVRVLQTKANAGPGGARNVGIEAMRGQWYCVLDCDDLMDSSRCRHLIDTATATGADMIADDLMVFGPSQDDQRHLGERAKDPEGASVRSLTLDDYFKGTQLFGAHPNLGFLKPMIRRAVLIDGGHRYREDLPIGEDDELVIQLLLAGCSYKITDRASYRYRRHDASISHRLSVGHSLRMMESEESVRQAVIAAGRNSRAYEARHASILNAVAFTQSVQALKERQWVDALRALARRPRGDQELLHADCKPSSKDPLKVGAEVMVEHQFDARALNHPRDHQERNRAWHWTLGAHRL